MACSNFEYFYIYKWAIAFIFIKCAFDTFQESDNALESSCFGGLRLSHTSVNSFILSPEYACLLFSHLDDSNRLRAKFIVRCN